MRKANYTAITEFVVLKPKDELETVGEKLRLSNFGEYCPDNSLRGYTLQELLINSENYKPSVIIEMGKTISLPS